MQLGFIGFGEAGYSIAKGLNEEGITNIKAFDISIKDDNLSHLLKRRAKDANVELLKEQKDIFSNSSIIFSALPASFALDVINNSLEFINNDLLYVDVSTAAPNDKRNIQEMLSDNNALYVDGAMTGRLVTNLHKVPILASGNGAREFQKIFSAYNMKISIISNIPGDATSIKLIRSIFMKGYATLCFEMLEAARKQGVEETIINGISHSLDSKSFRDTMNLFITGTAVHSKRRAAELKGSLELLNSMEIDSTMTSAILTKLEKVTETNLSELFESEAPDEWIEVIDALLLNNY